jgi:hypothetical protein
MEKETQVGARVSKLVFPPTIAARRGRCGKPLLDLSGARPQYSQRFPARSSTAWQDPEVPARPETDAVLGPPAQKGVPSYKVVVEGD